MATRIQMLIDRIDDTDPNWRNVTRDMIAQGRITLENVDETAEMDVAAWSTMWGSESKVPGAADVAEVIRHLIDEAPVNLTGQRITVSPTASSAAKR